MKYVVALTALLFMGCNSKTEQVNINDYAKFDSIITKSQQNLEIANGVSKKSDSLVTGKIEKTAQKITKLETEVKQLKAENNELKEKLNDLDDDGSSFRIRAISDN